VRYPVLLRVAHLCWGIPLLLAAGPLLAYWRTGAGVLTAASLALLIVGILVMLVGFACLAAFVLLNRRTGEPDRSRGRRRALLALALLALNVPVAVFYLLVGMRLAAQIHLHIVNAGAERLDQVTVISRHNRIELGPLAPGQATEVYFDPRGKTGVDIRIRRGPEVRSAEITGYAMGFGVDDHRVVVAGDLRITFQRLPNR
jgi:hypothetical protein